jgi:hypothetical protein
VYKISNTKSKGRGVFATKNIKEGSLIMECPTVRLSPADCHFIQNTVLQDYVLMSGSDWDRSRYSPLGDVAFLNHDNVANAKWGFGTNKEMFFSVCQNRYH